MNPLRLLVPILMACSAASAAPASSSDRLDQKTIHAQYNEGNFEKVVAVLEGFMSTHPSYAFEDSVFIAKHLAVVYTANPDTREKGKYYMYRLLALLPSAKLVDMYVSDEIDRIFDKVREEFVTRQRGFGVDTARIALPGRDAGANGKDAGKNSGQSAGPAVRKAGKKESHTGLWVAGGAAVALAGLSAVYFIHMGEEPASDKVYRVPKE